MIYTKYTIKTTVNDADIVSALLTDFGINDIEIENNVQLTDDELNRMYADFVRELPENDGTCLISFFIPEKEDGAAGSKEKISEKEDGAAGSKEKISRVWDSLKEEQELLNLSPMEFSEVRVDSGDWENKWKEYFKPFKVGDVMICPTWEDVPDCEYAALVRIDPGMAFGTGLHETTRLCLSGIRKYLKPRGAVLDLGCGSGILSIASLKLEAGSAVCVDIDPEAAQVARENFKANGIPEGSYEILTGNILKDEELCEYLERRPADLVLANILADVIEPLSGRVHKFMKRGGIFIASGIIEGKEEAVSRAVMANPCLSLLETVSDGDWRAVIAVRK